MPFKPLTDTVLAIIREPASFKDSVANLKAKRLKPVTYRTWAKHHGATAKPSKVVAGSAVPAPSVLVLSLPVAQSTEAPDLKPGDKFAEYRLYQTGTKVLQNVYDRKGVKHE